MQHHQTRRHAPSSDGQPRLAVLAERAVARARLVYAATQAGIDVGVTSAVRPDVVVLIQQAACDAVLFSVEAPDGVPPELADAVGRPLVLCSQNTSHEMLSAVQRTGAMAFLVEPLRVEQLAPTLALASMRFRELESLRSALADRKIIERAKGRLMALQGATEEDAFRWLRRRAMDRRSRIVDVARDILTLPT